MSKFSKKHYIISFVLVTAFTFLIWHRSLGQGLIGEGAIYLTEPYVSMLDKEGGFKNIANRHDVFPILFTYMVGNYFRDQMWFYYLSMLIMVSLVNYLLYLLLFRVTGQWFSGAVAVSFVAANYVGSFQKLGQGYYQWFIQRIPQFIPGLLALIFLVQFFANKKKTYYFISVFFYLLAFFLAHYTLLMLPLFVIYPLAYVLVNSRKNFKQYSMAFIQTIPFILGSYLLLQNQGLNADQISFSNQINSKNGVLYYLNHAPWLADLTREITLVTVPIDMLKGVADFINRSFTLEPSLSFSTLEIVQNVSFVVVVLLIAIFLFVFSKVDTKVRPFFIAVALGIPLVTFTVMYINPGAISNSLDTSRYLYVPSMVMAMFWGVCLLWFFNKGFILKIIVFTIVASWVIYNAVLIDSKFTNWQPAHTIVLATVEYVRNNHSDFPEKSIIVTEPAVGGYSSGMLEHFYGGDRLKVVHYDASLQERLKILKGQYDSVIFLRYKDKKIESTIKNMEEVINSFDASIFKK